MNPYFSIPSVLLLRPSWTVPGCKVEGMDCEREALQHFAETEPVPEDPQYGTESQANLPHFSLLLWLLLCPGLLPGNNIWYAIFAFFLKWQLGCRSYHELGNDWDLMQLVCDRLFGCWPCHKMVHNMGHDICELRLSDSRTHTFLLPKQTCSGVMSRTACSCIHA